jgi:MarR family transcriptional regulator, transcriptional regulator for hemolysin
LSKSKVLEYDFEESIGYWIYMTSRALEQAMNAEMAAHGITYRQFQVLAWLALEDELSQNQLADRMRIEAPTLVGILDRMEEQGWIQRRPDRVDRRRKIIIPTPKVKPVWEKMTAHARRVRAQATEGISPEDIELVKQVMARIQGNLRSRSLEESVA